MAVLPFSTIAGNITAGKSEDWMGAGLKGVRRSRVPDDQGLYAWARQGSLRCACLTIVAPAAKPITWTFGRSTACASKTILPCSSGRIGAAEALEQAKKEGKVRFVGFHGTQGPIHSPENASHRFSVDSVANAVEPI